MTDLLTASTPGTSPTTRLVAQALAVLESCQCSREKRAVILRSFDGRSRRRASQIKARLRHGGAVTAVDAAVPVLAMDVTKHHGEHVCAYVDCNEATGEAERLAALTRTPLVTLPDHRHEAGPPRNELARPALRADLSSGSLGGEPRPFPSSIGRVPEIALDTFVIVPNQPEVGELDVQVGHAGRRALDSGTSVTLRCLPETILVQAADPRGETVTWFAGRVEIRQHAGIHRIYRDGLCVTDLNEAMLIEHDPAAVRRFDV